MAVGIVFFFIVSSTIPRVLGNDVESEIQTQETTLSDGPMDSPWPMKCHDNRHTGLSSYSTASNPGIEKWRFKCNWVEGGIVIGDDGALYFGDSDYLFALNSDGSMKWKYHTIESITSSPAIAEDGIIYVGSWDDCLHAVYSNNGTRKWKFSANSANIASSPAIAEDGTIYFGTLWSLGDGGKIHAVNPDGTEKWQYQTGNRFEEAGAWPDDVQASSSLQLVQVGLELYGPVVGSDLRKAPAGVEILDQGVLGGGYILADETLSAGLTCLASQIYQKGLLDSSADNPTTQ